MRLRCLLGYHKYIKEFLTPGSYEMVCVHCRKVRDIKKARKEYIPKIIRR